MCNICLKQREEYCSCEDGEENCNFEICEKCYISLVKTGCLDMFIFESSYFTICSACSIKRK